ncbi:Protein F14B6.2 [Aphelenchoides avenae]|nr:Protein F14B6.2 [Aphelenchus avenae]
MAIQTDAPPTTTMVLPARRPAIFEKAAPLSRPPTGHNFTEQLSTFTSSAVCAARTLAVVWCALQVAAAVPFVVGIFARLRCFFTAHLILDALFLVVLFIYSVTMTIFALILYVCVADMSTQTLFEWLLFAAALDVLFVVYTLAFVATLRCCEELLADQPNSGVRTYRAKSLLYTQIPDADTLTDVNSV